MSRRAVILAGGKGTRLQPYTVVLPKPLMPVGEQPILEVVVKQLVHFGFDHITMAVNHQAELIKAFFGNGSKWGTTVDYSLEDTPLGTMGPLRLIPDLPEHFLVMNGDVLTDMDLAAFHDHHVMAGSLFTISSHRREEAISYGVLETNGCGHLIGFHEKPKTVYEVSMGIYMVSQKALELIPSGMPYGFDDLMSDFLSSEQQVHVHSYDGYWLDIGRPDDYTRANADFDEMKSHFLND